MGFLKTKVELFSQFQKWKTSVEKQLEKQSKMFKEFTNYCRFDGVVIDVDIFMESGYNGVAKSMSRILKKRAMNIRLTANMREILHKNCINDGISNQPHTFHCRRYEIIEEICRRIYKVFIS